MVQSVPSQSSTAMSATIFTPRDMVQTRLPGSTDAMVTAAPPRTKVSATQHVSISSLPGSAVSQDKPSYAKLCKITQKQCRIPLPMATRTEGAAEDMH